MKRTDCHRPGAIVPGDYRPVLYYSLPSVVDGWPCPSWRVNCELDRRVETRDRDGKVTSFTPGEHDADGKCCVVGLLHIAKVKFADHGATGKCTVCGAGYIEGDIWEHVATGVHIHVGHICAAKYDLITDWTAEECARERMRRNACILAAREHGGIKRAEFLAAHPGLEAALKLDHRILADMADRFRKFGDLSEKQIAFALKLADEVRNPPPAELKTTAPTGKQTFRGRVVSVKSQESQFGIQMRMTVKVETPSGAWLAWGTAPSALLDAGANHDGGIRGAEVEVTATLEAGREPNFAIMKRPRGKMIRLGCGADCSWCRELAERPALSATA